MSRDERVTFWIGISVFNLVRFDDLEGSMTVEAVFLFLSKFDPLDRGQISVFWNHPGNTYPRAVAVLSHCRNEVAVGIRVGTAGSGGRTGPAPPGLPSSPPRTGAGRPGRLSR